jgi:phage-related protein
VNTVVSVIRGVNRIVGIVSGAFNQARNAVSNAISGMVDFVRGLPGKVVGALGNIGRTLYDKGRDLIQGFINGIRDMAGNIVSTIKNFVIDKIPGPIKSALGIGSPSRVMAEFGRNIGEGLVAGIEAGGDKVADAMRQLVPVPKAATVAPAFAAVAANVGESRAVQVARAAAVAPVTVNVHPREGQSEYEIGRIAAREVAWAAKTS